MAKSYGKWRVISSIGEGGQGQVFLVSGENDDTQYALKRLRNLDRLDRFRREVSVIQKINHPGVIKIVDHELESPRPYFVTPYMPLGSLRNVEFAKLDIGEKFRIFEEILSALSEAHCNDVVHRDIKPENILILDGNRPVVADFGIALLVGDERLTATGEVVGPRGFSAPEVDDESVGEVGKHTDVYSLGKLLYWILSGRVLPREAYRSPSWDLVRTLGSKAEYLNYFFDKAISHEVDARFPDATAMLSEFSGIIRRFEATINFPSPRLRQRCIYCGVGVYLLVSPTRGEGNGTTDPVALDNLFGMQPRGTPRLRAMACSDCGNIQFFGVEENSPWRNPAQ